MISYCEKEIKETDVNAVLGLIEKEKYFEAVQGDLEELKNGVKHDKNKDLVKFKDELKELLEEEIISRYYYRSGKIEASFDDDKDIKTAVEVLKDKERYDKLLASGVVGEED